HNVKTHPSTLAGSSSATATFDERVIARNKQQIVICLMTFSFFILTARPSAERQVYRVLAAPRRRIWSLNLYRAAQGHSNPREIPLRGHEKFGRSALTGAIRQVLSHSPQFLSNPARVKTARRPATRRPHRPPACTPADSIVQACRGFSASPTTARRPASRRAEVRAIPSES